MMKNLVRVFACLAISAGATPALAQSRPAKAVIAVVEGYPAFRSPADQPHPRALELEAFTYRVDPTDSTRSVILLSPTHATPETLALGLQSLLACPPAGSPVRGRGTNIIAGRRHPPVRPELVRQAAAYLASIRNQPVGRLQGHGDYPARFITIPLSTNCTPALPSPNPELARVQPQR
jgi:hypothetical protein